MKMMKTLAIGLLMLPLLAVAAPFQEGVHFEVLHQGPATDTPEINEFFSFGCPACRSMEPYVALIKSEMPDNVEFKQTHVEFLGAGDFGPDVTRAWATAEILGVAEQVKQPMFAAVQDNRAVRDGKDARQVILSTGVDAKEYDAAASSFMINGMLAQMRKDTEDYQIRGVPTFIVNGKYQVLTGKLRSGQQLKDLVLWLTEQK